MKRIIFLLSTLSSIVFSQQITNDTNETMLCQINYPALYEKEMIHNIEQRVMVQTQEEFTTLLEPQKSYEKVRKGSVVCFNSQKKITL